MKSDNALLDFLTSHVSVRKFTDQPVDEKTEMTIVTTAQRSPTSSNLQTYSIISVRDPHKKKRLAEWAGDQAHVEQCPLFLVFCADLYRLSLLSKARNYDFHGDYTEPLLIATVDAALVAGRALDAARALGMGGVMVGGIRSNAQEVSDLLELPNLVYPVMGMSLGYPANIPRVKPRLPIEALYFRERYDDSAIPAAIKVYDQAMDAVGHLKGREVEPEKYPNFEGNYSWSEHSARRMASTKKGTLRPHLLAFLQKRGLLRK